jgi:hypothetical protein
VHGLLVVRVTQPPRESKRVGRRVSETAKSGIALGRQFEILRRGSELLVVELLRLCGLIQVVNARNVAQRLIGVGGESRLE